jgi:ABC-2 type transport system permease protein
MVRPVVGGMGGRGGWMVDRKSSFAKATEDRSGRGLPHYGTFRAVRKGAEPAGQKSFHPAKGAVKCSGSFMRKYLHFINIGIQSNLAYRFNYLTRTLFSFIPLFAMLSLWRTVYGAGGSREHSGYTQAQIMFYYLLVAVVDVLTAVNEDDWQIAADIREGNISQFLLKPVDYLTYRLCLFVSGRLAYMAMAVIPLAVFIFCFRANVTPPADAAAGLACLVSLVLTALLQFFISYGMAMLAFWLLEISTFIFILFAMEYLASGHMFPLDMLPPALQTVLAFTPFPYEMYFPVSVYLGRAAGHALVCGLLTQLAWVLAAYLFARVMWWRGIKKYSAFGG